MKQILTLFIICFALIIIWFHKGLIFAGGEESIPFYDLIKTEKYYSPVWHELGAGYAVVNLQRFPIFKLLSIFYSFGIPGFVLQAFLFFIIMSVGTVSTYFLIKITIFENLDKTIRNKYKYAPLVAGIFYLLNPFSMTQIFGRGAYMQFFPFALLPLFLTLFIFVVKRKKIIYGIFALLSSVIFSAAFDHIGYAFALWLLVFMYTIFHIFRNITNKKEVIFTTFLFISMLLGWFILHLFWILPFLKLFTQPYVGIVDNPDAALGSLRGVSRQYPLHILIRLMHSGYFFEDLYGKAYSTFIFGLISWLIPLVALFSINEFKKLSHFLFFGTLFLIGLFISLGSNFPTGWLFEIIFKYAPPLQMYRNPFEKFGLVFLIAYVPFFSLGVLIFAEKIGNFFKKEKLRFISLMVIPLLVSGIFVWPMWKGIFAGGYRLNPWIKVPDYYQELQNWLDENKEGYRIFMTPLWSGDGAFYQWNNTRFQGVDPMVYLINQSAVSYSSLMPALLLSIRKYMERINMGATLALLRAKFVVDREDAIRITEGEKQHKRFLTEAIFPPIGTNLGTQKVCQDKYAQRSAYGVAWIICQIPEGENDWVKIKYAHFVVKTDVPAFWEFALSDKNKTRIRWYGPLDSDYQSQSADWVTLTIPLNAPTEYNPAIDFSKVSAIEVLAHPKDSPQKSVQEISLKEIVLDTGKEEKLNSFRLIQTFGNLKVYEPIQFNPPPEIGSLTSLEQVKDIVSLFIQADKQKDQINKMGFVVDSQNIGKDLTTLPLTTNRQAVNVDKISESKYWLEFSDTKDSGLIILSKAFNPEWKVIPGVKADQLSGGLLNDFNLLKKVTLSEDQHFLINGYANLWKIDGQDVQYAIIFIPQIFADIGLKISIIAWWFVGGLTLILVLKSLRTRFKNFKAEQQ